MSESRTAVTANMLVRVIELVRAREGVATIEQIREAEVVPGALVQSALRVLIASKKLTMHGVGTYSISDPVAAKADRHLAQLPQLAGPSAVGSMEQNGRNQVDNAPMVDGSAEPGPRRRGRPKQGGKQAPSSTAIECLRCHCTFPTIEFASGVPGRRRFRLCKTCRASSAPRPAKIEPIAVARAPDTHEHFARVLMTPVLFDYLEQLRRTGLHGATPEQVIDRLICEGIARAIVGGLLKPATGERT